MFTTNIIVGGSQKTSKVVPPWTTTYLACELHQHQPLKSLHSGTTATLHRLHEYIYSDFHRHSFVVSAPATWNNIPAILARWTPSKLLSKLISLTAPTRYATDSHPSAPPIHFSVTYDANQRNPFDWLIDWLISYLCFLMYLFCYLLSLCYHMIVKQSYIRGEYNM